MTPKTTLVVMLWCLFVLPGTVVGQEEADMLGKWTFTATGIPDDPRCGALSSGGEMKVERKITARAYRGSVRSYRSSERCKGRLITESAVTVRIRDNKVSIDYDEDGWTADSLILNGSAMTGTNESGIATEWIKQDTVEDQARTTSEAAMSEFESVLAEIEPKLTSQLRSEFGRRLQKGVERSGLSEEEAGQVVDRTLERMTSCVLDSVRETMRVQNVPLDGSVSNRNAGLVLDPRRMDFKSMECIQDAGQNAGVTIR
jgi:hypothetical protein